MKSRVEISPDLDKSDSTVFIGMKLGPTPREETIVGKQTKKEVK